MRISLPGAVCICCLVILIRFAAADPPSTQPAATQQSELSADSPMRKWFNQLADPDPKIRDQAKIDLMGIDAGDLPKLRQLVIDSQPISPGQSAALHDVVVQAFLASEKYDKLGGGETDASGSVGPFFLGITWEVPDSYQARLGVSVDGRLPGFPSYRFLRTGDMILGVYLDPDAPLEKWPNVTTHVRDDLVTAINPQDGTHETPQNIVLEVLRGGETMKIALKLAPRPQAASAKLLGPIQMFNNDRVQRADAYWQKNFTPLLDPNIVASNLAEGP